MCKRDRKQPTISLPNCLFIHHLFVTFLPFAAVHLFMQGESFVLLGSFILPIEYLAVEHTPFRNFCLAFFCVSQRHLFLCPFYFALIWPSWKYFMMRVGHSSSGECHKWDCQMNTFPMHEFLCECWVCKLWMLCLRVCACCACCVRCVCCWAVKINLHLGPMNCVGHFVFPPPVTYNWNQICN